MEPAGRRPRKVGLVRPSFDQPWAAAPAPGWAELLATARLAEGAGFDSLWLGDHLLVREADQGSLGVWEAWSLLAALAAATEGVERGPLVACAAFRNPALLAKLVATVDEISGGRLTLGLGAGWHEPEFRAFGFPFDRRVARFAEALTITAGLLREGQVDVAGVYHQARDSELRPRGPRHARRASHGVSRRIHRIRRFRSSRRRSPSVKVIGYHGFAIRGSDLDRPSSRTASTGVDTA